MFNGGKNITSVQLPAVLAPPDGKKFDLEPATVPPSVPVVAVVSSCDVEVPTAKASKHCARRRVYSPPPSSSAASSSSHV